MDFQAIIAYLLDLYQGLRDALLIAGAFLISLVTLTAIIWYVLGLLPAPFYQKIRIRVKFWRLKSRLALKANNQSDDLVSSMIRIFAKARPKAAIELSEKESENILETLSKIVQISRTDANKDWVKLWSKIDSIWLGHFLSKCGAVQEPLLQEALVKAFAYEAATPGRFTQRDIDIIATISVQQWKLFTTICSFTCCIGGRVTPVVFNCDDDIYRKVGLSAEALDNLVSIGMITKGGTGDTYTLEMPDEGLGILYFYQEEFVAMPLSKPIPRSYFTRTLTQPHPFDRNLNVGVVDFTPLGRSIGFLTPCIEIPGFPEYLRCQWKEHLVE